MTHPQEQEEDDEDDDEGEEEDDGDENEDDPEKRSARIWEKALDLLVANLQHPDGENRRLSDWDFGAAMELFKKVWYDAATFSCDCWEMLACLEVDHGLDKNIAEDIVRAYMAVEVLVMGGYGDMHWHPDVGGWIAEQADQE